MLVILASLSAGIAAGCLFLLLAELLGQVELERGNPEENERRKLPLLFRMYLPFAGSLRFITRKSFLDSVRKNTGEMIMSAGLDQAITPSQFIGIRILFLLTGLILMVLMFMAGQPFCGFLILGLFFIYPDAWLRKTVKLRHIAILKALPNVLDLLTLSVEAGKDFLTALRDILARRANDSLGDELKRTLHEIQLGKQRQQALRDLAFRVHQPELTSVVNAIVQADELGVGIGQLLRIQGDQLRNKRFSRAETMANEAPVKILFPVVLFIFPSVFIILIAPIIAQAMQTLSM